MSRHCSAPHPKASCGSRGGGGRPPGPLLELVPTAAAAGVGVLPGARPTLSHPRRKPWEHVIAAGATAYLFQWIADQEDAMVKQIEEHYAKFAEQRQQ